MAAKKTPAATRTRPMYRPDEIPPEARRETRTPAPPPEEFRLRSPSPGSRQTTFTPKATQYTLFDTSAPSKQKKLFGDLSRRRFGSLIVSTTPDDPKDFFGSAMRVRNERKSFIRDSVAARGYLAARIDAAKPGGRYDIVHLDARGWRISRFDRRGPFGHSYYRTYEDALYEALVAMGRNAKITFQGDR